MKTAHLHQYSVWIGVLLLILTTSSCISNKKVTYLQNAGKDKRLAIDSLITYHVPVYKLQYNDIVEVKIKTTIPEMNAIFGLDDPSARSATANVNTTQSSGDIFYLTGYIVDAEGNIKLPFIGKVNVMGLTLEEASTTITGKLASYFKKLSEEELYVNVKLGGIRFSTFGEFNKPGKYLVLQERMTIFDAIAQSGDLNVQAKRSAIKLLRQYPGGTRIHILNLNDRSIIGSPYYFIQPNDQIYAEPLKTREFGTGVTGAQSLNLLFGVLSAAAVVIGLTR